MWDANYGGPQYSTQAYNVSGPMLSMLGGIVGDSAVWHAMSDYAKAWRFKHPSPWDYAFYMSNALHKDLGWFWYYWLFTTESVDGSIENVTTVGTRTTVTVHQDGQMPSPVMLAVEFAPKGPAIHQMSNSRAIDSLTVLVTYPVDVWFNGSKTFKAAWPSVGGRSRRSPSIRSVASPTATWPTTCGPATPRPLPQVVAGRAAVSSQHVSLRGLISVSVCVLVFPTRSQAESFSECESRRVVIRATVSTPGQSFWPRFQLPSHGVSGVVSWRAWLVAAASALLVIEAIALLSSRG